ncbi:hypothetical protein Pelo_10668 [Pelomyxa schiedti]|nr:hypothetical protein Pelo_10668 [Pelomyxa schiedti]
MSKRGPAATSEVKQYFQQTPGGWECNYRADPSAPKCKHKPFALSAGTSTLGYHLEKAHKFVKKSQQPTPTATQTIDKYVQAVLGDRIPGLSKNQLDVALAFAMLGLPFSMLSSPYFRRILSPEKIYGASPEKIHAWINLLYDWLRKGLTEFVAAHEAVAVTFDGGKDISGNKLIATYAEDYTHLISECFTELEASPTTVVGATCDNEHAETKGLKAAIESHPTVIPVRCMAHCLELTQAKILAACPPLNAIVTQCHAIASNFKIHKQKRKQLNDIQLQYPPEPSDPSDLSKPSKPPKPKKMLIPFHR